MSGIKRELLSTLGVILATGEEAASFLQGQLTNDVASMSPDQARLAGYCTAKGRLLGQFTVLRQGADLFLITDKALLPALVKRLSMFVLRAKCKLRDVSDDFVITGLKGSTPELSEACGIDLSGTSAQMQVKRNSDNSKTAVIWFSSDEAQRVLLLSATDRSIELLETPEGEKFWAHDDILCGIPQIESRTVETFVPQMVNLDLIGGVNFQKGCYPGQEIVARSHYLGKMKRRMHLGHVITDTLAPGADIFASTHPNEPAGKVVSAAKDVNNNTVFLFEVSSDLLEGATLHLNTLEGPEVCLGKLPYSITQKPN